MNIVFKILLICGLLMPFAAQAQIDPNATMPTINPNATIPIQEVPRDPNAEMPAPPTPAQSAATASTPVLRGPPVDATATQSSPVNTDGVKNSDEPLLLYDRIATVHPNIDLDQIPSLFLTPSEQSLISEARLGLTARSPSDYELSQSENKEANIPMGPRELALGGIVYASSNEWTIWINGEKITPKRLPSEILDIKVYKDYIKLKWFDAYTNQIFPIKMRTHQRFNIDTRIFLPGEGVSAPIAY